MVFLNRRASKCRGRFPRLFSYWRERLNELSLFIDESGSDGLKDRYYLLTLVLHEQNVRIVDGIRHYERALTQKGLPDIPFHASPLLNGHDDYRDMSLAERKRLLSAFRVFFRHMPVRYACISLKVRDYGDVDAVTATMRRRLVDLLFDELAYFQQFDAVKIYYDNGQHSLAEAIHEAMDYAFAKGVVVYREAIPADYRLSQVADYICTIELTALKYADKAITRTDEKFFGSWSQFKKGPLKEVRAKRIGR